MAKAESFPKLRPTPSPAQINVAVEDVPLAVKEARMDAAIRAHVLQMESELRAGTSQSLDVAVERWVARQAPGASTTI